MKLKNLVEMVKEVGRQNLHESHSRRYQRTLSMANKKATGLNLAEEETDDEEENEEDQEIEASQKKGGTATGKQADQIVVNPELKQYANVPQGAKPELKKA